MSTTVERVAIVTGGAAGIGWATARRLAEDLAHVVIADLDGAAAEARARELGAAHAGLACNVADEAAVKALVAATLARFGRIDVLVNNAGVGEQPGGTLDQGVEAFDRIVAIHLRGTFLASREAARVMVGQRSGAIVNMSSITALGGHPGRNAYGAAKAGISSMTASMAAEWARSGLRVNAVAPGYVLTELVRKLAANGSLDLPALEARTPLGRLALDSDVAEAIAFLVSERAGYITGVTLPVDGGWSSFGATEARLAATGGLPA